jgi:hypothetical protein
MKIKVTQKDIDKGLRSSCYYCPIAHAFKRAVKNNIRYGCCIGSNYIVHCPDGKWNRYELPKEARKFIKRFDHCQPVEPFSFEIKKGKPLTFRAAALL